MGGRVCIIFLSVCVGHLSLLVNTVMCCQ